jgi:hypothetical protein
LFQNRIFISNVLWKTTETGEQISVDRDLKQETPECAAVGVITIGERICAYKPGSIAE